MAKKETYRCPDCNKTFEQDPALVFDRYVLCDECYSKLFNFIIEEDE